MEKTFILKTFVFFTIILLAKNEEEHGHEHSISRDNIFEEIFEHLNTTLKDSVGHSLLTEHNFEKLFQDLNFRTCNSTEESSNCNLCYKANDFLKWNKFDGKKNVSEEEFQDLIPGLIYLLTPLLPSSNAVCRDLIDNKTLNENTKFYNKLQVKYGQTIDEEALEKILEDINKTIGVKLTGTGKECFSAHDVLKGANVSEHQISETDFKYVSGFIVLKLVDGNCIKGEEESDHPKPNFFVDEIFEEFGGANDTGITHDGFDKFYKKLSLGATATTEEEGGDHSGHDGHKRRRRRRSAEHNHEDEEKFKKCYSGEQILEIYSVEEGTTISKTKFQEICPSLVQQLESGVCKTQTQKHTSNEDTDDSKDWRPWVATVISVLIISLGSLSGVVTLPISKKKWFPFLLITLMSLAVAVMIGDAVLHLFPHALNLHGHEEGAHAHEEEGNPLLAKDSYIWKSMLLLLGVYLFFMFEMVMHALGAGHTHSHDLPANDVVPNTHAKGSIQMNETNSVICVGANGFHDCRDENSEASLELPPKKQYEYTKTKPQYTSMRDFQTVVWMVILGDGIHNFLDGVAIGVAFSESWPNGYYGGISTSIAILAHEVPHELGDFAVLLNSGLSIRQALGMNFLSSLVSFIGGFVGVALGTEWQASPWIFSITAGLFIYIALVDMLPEVLHSQSLKKHSLLTIGLANIGLLTGFAIMFVLGAYEEDIKSVLQKD